MEQRTLGNSGLSVSTVGLGCNNFGMRIAADAAQVVVDKAVDLGVTFFDTAELYGMGASEEMLGKALGSRRADAVICTKFGVPSAGLSAPGCGSRRYIMTAVDKSLRRLDTDYIDLYMVHFPDPKTPISETVGTLDDLVRAGKVRYYGLSNVASWQLVEAQYEARLGHRSPFIAVENEWSLVDRAIEKDVAPAARKYGVGILPYFPLAGGFLTGKYRRGETMPAGGRLTEGMLAGLAHKYITDRNWGILDAAERFSAEHGHSVLDLAMSWLLSQPGVASVMSGATKPEQLEANVAAASWRLSPDEMAAVAAFTA